MAWSWGNYRNRKKLAETKAKFILTAKINISRLVTVSQLRENCQFYLGHTSIR